MRGQEWKHSDLGRSDVKIGEAAETPFEFLEPAGQHAGILVAGKSGTGSVDVLLRGGSVAQVQAGVPQADVERRPAATGSHGTGG